MRFEPKDKVNPTSVFRPSTEEVGSESDEKTKKDSKKREKEKEKEKNKEKAKEKKQ